jgi:sporulation protein YlmC with PRC-barrel domain
VGRINVKEIETMKSLLLAGTALIALTPVVAAQTANNGKTANLKSNLTEMLQKSGYTDIRIAPTSFVVRAKDNQGDPVVMSISPDEFTAVTAVNDTAGASKQADNQANNSTSNQSAANNGSNTYVNVPANDELSSKLVGLDIYNKDNKDIGTIKDIALDPNGRTTAYVVSVGGFLGMGDHYVAVNPAAVNVTYNKSDNKWHASMNATADQLKAAPEFKYSGRWNG